ncbi:MAG: branched-chain amino acid ABC transporter permease, partial [Pseudomonadota bacterium]
KNLAQGDFVIMGGYVTWVMAENGIHPLFGVPVSFVVLWAFGWALYKTVIARVIGRDLFTSLLATFGIAIVIEQVLNILFTSDTQTADADFPSLLLFDGMVTLPQVKLIGFCLAALLALAVILFMKHSRTGQAIRATSQDARAARVMGIDTEKVYAFTFSLNAAICGAAGALVAMIWVIQPFFGITYSIRSFVVVVAAGLGNLPGVIAAGLGMGVVEQFGGFILGAEFQQAIVVGLLLLVLMYRQAKQARLRQVVQ